MKKIVKGIKTQDVAIGFKMVAGFPGDVNRTHPASITAELTDVTFPPTLYGQGVIVNPATSSVRQLKTTDTTTPVAIYGITVRPFPSQQTSGGMTAGFGTGTPPVSGVIDIIRSGFIIVNLPFGGSPVKNGPVYIRIAASSGLHVQGAFEAVADTLGTNTVLVSNAVFNSSPDANGNVEIAFNI